MLQMELKRTYLTFLASVFNAGLHDVLLEGGMDTGAIMESMLVYGKDSTDTVSQKMCLSILGKVVKSWNTKPGVQEWIYNTLTPRLFQIPTSKTFQLTDGSALIVVTELGNILVSAYSVLGDDYLRFLESGLAEISDRQSVATCLEGIRAGGRGIRKVMMVCILFPSFLLCGESG